jgi:aminoglycoside 6'-N-acetyltransferase I
MNIDIARCTAAGTAAWRRMRAALWPEADTHDADIVDILTRTDRMAFLALLNSAPIGFAEAALRHDYVNGCETSPVAFLEGIYVESAHRRAGVARALVQAVEQWARCKGCMEFASDALLDNIGSHRMHQALGFEETERVVYFRKSL